VPRETPAQKASRLILASAIRFSMILPGEAVAHVRGDHGEYDTWFDGRQWTCTCYAARHSCSHIEACQKVYMTVLPGVKLLLEEAQKMLEGRD
jgi:hypothetical protein